MIEPAPNDPSAPRDAFAPLLTDHLPLLWDYWREVHPDCPMAEPLLVERVFGPPDCRPEHTLAHFDGDRLFAFALIVPPGATSIGATDEPVGGIRWLSVHPSARDNGLGSRLLDAACARLRDCGASAVRFLATPPFYLQPGVDTRRTDLIAWLLRRAFIHERTNFNMSVDLAALALPPERDIFGPDADGYLIRRAEPRDFPAFETFMRREWTESWLRETAQAFNHDPVSLFLTFTQDQKIVGFAAYETSQFLGSWGPTGVSPDHRGHRLGLRLLQTTLLDMKNLGRHEAQIGWVGPVDFYHRAAAAILGPVFWQMRRELKG